MFPAAEMLRQDDMTKNIVERGVDIPRRHKLRQKAPTV
jgi:hypothetical protein